MRNFTLSREARIWAAWLVLLVLALAACGEQPTPTPTSRPESGSAAVFPTATPTVPPTPTPEPTPIVPAIDVEDQTLDENGRIFIADVVVPQQGWLVIHAVEDGEPGAVLGYTAVSPGANPRQNISVDPKQVTETLIAMLHIDAGTPAQFEFPGPDEPLSDGAAPVMAEFSVEIDLPGPEIEVAEQEIGYDGVVQIDSAYVLEPGWLVIHATDGDTIGDILGQIPLERGPHQDLSVPIRWRDATSRLAAMLHVDAAQAGGFNPAEDKPLLVEGVPVVADFNVTLPPDVLIYDQPIIDNSLIAERVISSEPAWLVIYTDDDGAPGLIAGSAPLEAGVNEQVVVRLSVPVSSPRLFLLLHEDTEPQGQFNFPGGDAPLRYAGQIVEPFVVNTTPGNYLITRDQALGSDGTVLVPLVTADIATWLVIYTNQNGEPGEIIGRRALPAGISRRVSVPIDTERVTKQLFAILHQNGGDLESFDYPGGVDWQLQRNRAVIASPFEITVSNSN